MNNSKKNILYSVIIVLCVLLIGIALSYAFFTKKINANGEKSNAKVITGNLDVLLTTSKYINNTMVDLIDDADIFTKADKTTFNVKKAETSTVDNLSYDIYLVDINMDEELKSEDLKWALYDKDEPTAADVPIANGNFFQLDKAELQLNQSRIELSSTDVHNYTLYIWLSNNENNLQNDLLNKKFSAKVSVRAITG